MLYSPTSIYCYIFNLLKRLYMSLWIVNQVKTNKCIISHKKLCLFAVVFVSLFVLNGYNNKYNYNCLYDTTIRYSAYNRNCFVRTSYATCHKTNWLQLTHWSLYLANTFSLTNVLEVEGSRSRLLEQSTATVCICAFSDMPFP